jgi:hypothetical protein
MKKFQRILWVMAAVAWVAGAVSCGSDIRPRKGVLMTEQGDIDLAVQYVAGFIPADAKVTYINFLTDKSIGRTLYATCMRVCYFENESYVMKEMAYSLTASGPEPSLEREETTEYPYNWPADGVAFSEIDFSKVAGYVQSAGEIVAAAGGRLEKPTRFSGISGYVMVMNGDPKNAYAEFSIQSQNPETAVEAPDIYDSFDFSVMNGQLRSPDGLEGPSVETAE